MTWKEDILFIAGVVALSLLSTLYVAQRDSTAPQSGWFECTPYHGNNGDLWHCERVEKGADDVQA